MHSIVATSLLVIALLSAVTVFITFGQSLSLTAPTWAFSAVALVGMAGARFLGATTPSTALQRIFVIACIVIGIIMLIGKVGLRHNELQVITMRPGVHHSMLSLLANRSDT